MMKRINASLHVSKPLYKRNEYFQLTPGFLVNADKSSSLRHLNVTGPHEGSKMPFYVAYGQGDTSVNGTYIADTITVAGATLKNQRLGAANESSFASGIFGLGYNIVFDEQKSKDPLVGHTVVDGLVKSGAINRRLFSLALGHTEDTNGTITFGGVDTGLYYDSLVGVPLVPSRGSPRVVEYTVKLEGLEVKGLDGVKSSDKNVTVLLDNGAPEIMLPDEMVKPILDKFGTRSIKVDGRERGSFTNCALGRKYADSRFGFKFAGKTIYISGQQVVRDTLSDGEQNYVKDKIGSDSDDWDGVCQLIFAPHLEGLPYLVGDPLLRHAYAVYDMDNKEVGLAQANFNSTKHNLVEIGKDDGIPKDKGEPRKLPNPPISFVKIHTNNTWQFPRVSVRLAQVAMVMLVVTRVPATTARITRVRMVVTRATMMAKMMRRTLLACWVHLFLACSWP